MCIYTVTCECCDIVVDYTSQHEATSKGWTIPTTLLPTDTWSDGTCPACGMDE